MDKNPIKVSVIVPVYNVEKYLSQCIETIISQNYKELEIILVDDGSTDNSSKICDEYAKKDERIKVIHKANEGVSIARNTGIEVATGEYICFVDGDDYIMQDYVEYLLKLAIENNTDISLTTEMFGNFQTKQVKNDKIAIWTGEQATIGILCYKIPIGVYSKIFKRSFLKDRVYFLKELFIGEGFNFNTTAFQYANRVAIGHRRIYYYRRDNSTSATTKFSIEKWKNGLYAIEVIKKNMIIKNKKTNNAWKFAWWHTNSDVYDIMVLANVENTYLDFYKKCKKITRTKWYYSLLTSASLKQKVRAFIMFCSPSIIPYLMKQRRKKYHIDVKN